MRSGEEKMLKETQKNWQERRSEKNSFEIFPSFFFFATSWSLSYPKTPPTTTPSQQQRHLGGFLNGDLAIMLTVKCAESPGHAKWSFLSSLFSRCVYKKNRSSGKGGLLGRWGFGAFVVVRFVQLIRFFRVRECVCCITRVLSCLVVIAIVLAKLSRLWASVVTLLERLARF